MPTSAAVDARPGAVDTRPVAMFDSGFGGLTVARAFIDLLPAEDLVYVADTGRYPYGPRSLGEVAGFAHEIGRYLVEEHDAKLVVVACNTATAAALATLQDRLPVPVIGVIEPGVRSLVRVTTTGRVGVIATVGTVRSGAYPAAIEASGATVEATIAACPGFVEFVERGDVESDQVTVLAERLLAPVIDAKVDALLLGCTHYPFLARTLTDVAGRDVVLVSSADETAFEVRALLDDNQIDMVATAGVSVSGDRHEVGANRPDRVGVHRFISSGDVEAFRVLGARLLGPELASAERAPW